MSERKPRQDAQVFEDIADGKAEDEKDEYSGPAVTPRTVQQRKDKRHQNQDRDESLHFTSSPV